MAKYSKAAQKSVESAMKRMEKGKLKSGKSAIKVTNPKQAIAIGLSEAKKKGAKVPARKKAVPVKAVAKKTVTKKKQAPAKVGAKKPQVKKVAAKKTVIKKKKAPAKAVAKKIIAKKAVPKKQIIKKKATPAKATKPKATKPKATKPKAIPAKTIAPPTTIQSEETLEKATHINETGRQQMMVTGDGLDASVKTEDPVTTFDKHMFQKATAKGDPHSKIHLASAGKNPIRAFAKRSMRNK